MQREEIKELHYITPICNVASILQHGLLSHNRAKKVLHRSVAMPEIQEKRARKIVPGAKPLHDYVNLYFHARNPMLYKRQAEHQALCVLRISPAVLDLPRVVITDGNAASNYTRFRTVAEGLQHLNRDDVFAEWWTDTNAIEAFRKKSAKCAEVLVPDSIPPRYIIGAYVACETARAELARCGFKLPIRIDEQFSFLV
ncbi:MAG: DUF4433 domain-containing protein [Candidatus Sumerlaeaceae bacterium]|nr:DUF4433 domain-containing protein [Candidatus Sumerlaeaceae bacterium]